MDYVADIIGAGRSWLAGLDPTLFGYAIPVELMQMLPFSVAALFAILSRNLVAIGAVVLCGFVSLIVLSDAVNQAERMEIANVVYTVSFIIAFSYALDALVQHERYKASKRRGDKFETAFAESERSLERERVWRRAGGDDRSVVADDELIGLIERVRGDVSKRSASQRVGAE